PKGTQLPGEELDQTALREVAEETGYEVKIIEYLGVLPSTYERLGQLVNKLTHYFLMETVGEPSQHDTEHDGLEWVDFDLAIERLAEFPIWEKEAEILEVAIAKL
ncbi:MAG TPA: NUDIX domain-containing protein, partial [Patescibacteria group bacterium]|nr:NUDIX domain-containing protein [Patescibacteria group bacterium]